jgi:hypothetical protein
MPFDHYVASIFSDLAIRRFAPDSSGIYGLSNAKEWVFVGQADNIKAALLAHLQETDTPISERVPTGFAYELCASGSRHARFERMILELEPICNRRMPLGRLNRRIS